MPIPILNVGQMREWEQATWASGQTEAAVIERVGKAIASRLLELTREGDRILILAGKGHNGDDARAARAHLPHRNVTLLEVREPAMALSQLHLLHTKEFSFIVDGLFGIGLSRPLNDAWQQLIAWVNASGIPVLSVDVPSGLNAESGEVEGAAIRATITLTVGAPKRGMLLPSAIPLVGRLEVLSDVGLVPPVLHSELNWVTAEDFCAFPPGRSVAAHKGSFGHVAILAGSLGYHGAAVLSARGAMRAQPGLVSAYTQPNVYVPVASQLAAAMVQPWTPETTLPDSCTAVLFGPGLAAKDLSQAFQQTLCDWWQNLPLPVVVDASALDWLPPGAVAASALRLITPHPGEAARMLKTTSSSVQGDRVAALRDLSRRYGGCWVVLKGNQSLIGQAEGDILVNSSGNPFLAQGGNGDLLAGFVSGLLAQPPLQAQAKQTISYAVWRHGASADKLTEEIPAWTTEMLATVL